MSYVQIDDLECENCNKLGLGELNLKTGVYLKIFKCCEDLK